jgi:DNA recombination protein RmuC
MEIPRRQADHTPWVYDCPPFPLASACTLRAMTSALTFIIGTVIGLLLGGGITFFLAKKTAATAEDNLEALAAKLLQQQSKGILDLAESKLTGKKEVIDESLKAMNANLARVETLMKSVGEGNASVKTRLDTAATAIKDLNDTAGGLKNALAGNSIRGQWGERMAEDVLRLAGMVEGINYTKQSKLQDSGSRPDFTFLLPKGQIVNMDVKFPFNNYQLYVDAKNDTEREKYKKDFLKDVKLRIKELQTRGYVNPQENTVDYVLLFIPNEQIFSFINEHARELIDEAMQGKTILCSPLSLYAILAVVRQSIDNFRMESTSQEMLKVFGTFAEQWGKFKDQMETVKNRFASTHKEYEELMGTRTRQLDKPLEKIAELRAAQDETPAILDATVAKAKTKVLAENIEQTLVR